MTAANGVRRNASDEPAARAAIVAEARRWVGTPYHHGGGEIGIGVDCGMILCRVFVAVGLVAPFDPRPYPPDFMMHSDEEQYLGIIRQCGGRESAGAPQPGDVVVWRVGRVFAHGGIVTEWPRLVHAYARARFVIEDDAATNRFLADPRRPRACFSLWPR